MQLFYSPNNELSKSVKIEQQGFVITKTTTSYFYDAFGRRIAKNSKVERLHKLNQQGKLVKYPTTLLHLRKTDKTTYQSTLMLWEGNRQIQEYTDDFVFTTVYDQDSFEAVSRIVQGRDDKCCDEFKVYHYHNNHLGTPQELTNEQGEVVWCNYEFAWGGRYTHYYNSQSLNVCAIIESDLQPIRFQGQFYDNETGLHYNRFRYYDSDVGMFIQRDPIGLLGGVNVYQYAPNPVHWVDPWGLAKRNPCTKTSQEDKLSSPNPIHSKEIREAYEDIISGKGVPNLNKDGIQKIYQGRENPTWSGATEWLVPDGGKNLHHRILRMPNGKMGYVTHHNYKKIRAFPSPWYPDGGKKPTLPVKN